MPLSSIDNLLKQIQSADEETMYMAVTEKAMEWMAAGLVAEANALLQTLWSHNIKHTENLWLIDEGLQVMWELSNQFPSSIPFQLKNIKEIETENWERNVEHNQLFNITDEPKQVLKAIEKYLTKEKPAGSEYQRATACAALIAARGNSDKTTHFIKLWGEGYLHYPANYSLSHLMRDSLTARHLLNGSLLPVFNLSKDTCLQQTKAIAAKLAERVQNGRTLLYGDLSWEQILHKISASAISQDTGNFSTEAVAKNYLGKPPAAANEIDDAEKRLQVTLPEDYKQFLLTSNGFECVSSIGATISPVDKVDYLINVDRTLVGIWTDDGSNYQDPFGSKLANSIIIGGIGEEQQLLLVQLSSQQWECWHLSSWTPGEIAYPNFRFYMEEELQRLESGFYS